MHITSHLIIICLIFDITICLNNYRDPQQSFCMCPRNVAHGPPKKASVNFRRPIDTKKEVYSNFQRQREIFLSNKKVSPLLFFSWAKKGGPHTHEKRKMSPPQLGHFLHTHPKNCPKCPPFEWPI